MGPRDRAKARREAAEVAEWQAQRARVESFIVRVRSFVGATEADGATVPLPLLAGEHALLVLPFVQLIDPRRLPSHFLGGTSGFTLPVTRRVGDQEPSPIDTGVVTVTDQRTVFAGSLHTRTWDYGAVIGYHSHPDRPWTAIALSDRHSVSGVRYDAAHADEFRFALALGLARYHRAEATLEEDLHRQLEELDRDRPEGATLPHTVGPAGAPTAPATIPAVASVPTPAAPTAAVPTWVPVPPPSVPVHGVPGPTVPPAGWYPDPSRTARLRWWDGRSWTQHAAH